MAEAWIKFRLHRDHQRVLQIAQMTGISNEISLACLVDWLRYCDFELPSGEIPLTREIVHRKAGWIPIRAAQRRKGLVDLADAMLDPAVGWLREGDDGALYVTDFEKHMGAGAKRRAQEADRKAAERKASASHADKPRTNRGRKSAPDEELDRRRRRIDPSNDDQSESGSELDEWIAQGLDNPLSRFDPQKVSKLWAGLRDILRIPSIATTRPGTPLYQRARSEHSDMANNIIPALLEAGDDAIRRSLEIAKMVRSKSRVDRPVAMWKTICRTEGILPERTPTDGQEEDDNESED